MKISIYRPQFDESFKQNALTSARKGAKVTLQFKQSEKTILVFCTGYGRPMGSLTVQLEDDQARVTASRIIEKDFYPFEAMLTKLVSSLRRRKIKSLIV